LNARSSLSNFCSIASAACCGTYRVLQLRSMFAAFG
jgi:hypothetical protein